MEGEKGKETDGEGRRTKGRRGGEGGDKKRKRRRRTSIVLRVLVRELKQSFRQSPSHYKSSSKFLYKSSGSPDKFL